jgi:hypothetical protein
VEQAVLEVRYDAAVMRTDEQTRVTNALAAAIEYISKYSASSLGKMVITELRAANALVSQGEERDIKDMDVERLRHTAWKCLETLRLRGEPARALPALEGEMENALGHRHH